MRARSKQDGRVYFLHTVEGYGDSLVFEYVPEDGQPTDLSVVGINFGRTGYDSIKQFLEYWEDVEN